MSFKKKTIIISLFLVLAIIGTIMAILLGINNHQLYINEFNAQIEKFGFYKNDIKILNQQVEQFWTSFGLIFSIIFISVGLIAPILILCGLFDE